DNGDHARTPSDLTALQYGQAYRIRLSKEGFEPVEQFIVMGSTTDNSTLKPKLRPLPGKIVVEVPGENGRDVRIFFDGLDQGLGPKIEKVIDGEELVLVTATFRDLFCTTEPRQRI